ncbi:RHS repeat-associated core domain-containing protein [Terriglobus albidus]|uniref:RHS repeat-associated core domain-containing protein n=1 Tax=Terriglobus albidus TaxID=1592106 RepID=UPI0021DFFBCC|nr:RHS repeat-associated core domain-containing protein [Terriglobus albidus]
MSALFRRALFAGFSIMAVGNATSLRAATTVAITSQGSPASGGSVTLTINGVSKTTRYGAFSTTQSIASALAAMFSADCNGPATAKADNNGVITVKPRGSGVLSSVQVTGSSDQGGTIAFGGSTTSTSPPTNTVLYTYNIQQTNGSSGYAADGKITAYSDSVNGTWSMDNGYDSLNRIATAFQTPVGRSSQYFCWDYDSFGNRTTQSISQSIFGGSPGDKCTSRATGALAVNNWVHYDQNNRPTESWASASPGSLSPDSAGNLTSDGQNSMLYDQEGRLCAVSGPGGNIGYLYDAQGQRVAKGTITSLSCNPSQNGFTMTEEIITTAGGAQTVRFDSQGAWTESDLTVGGQLAATYRNDGQDAHFHMADWLGSKRFTTTSDGAPELKCESGAFGDGQICSALATNASDVSNVHFTDKERDQESGLDYFGARYYGSSIGRFMSPDPSGLAYASPGNPQSLNLYSYALNNPLRFIDPSGLTSCFYGGEGDTTENDHDPTDYEDTGTDAACIANGGKVLSVNATVDVHADGSGAGDITTVGDGLTTLINVWVVPNIGGCPSAVKYAGKTMAGVKRADASSAAINDAASKNNVPAALIDAIGMEETDFSSVQEKTQGGGTGPGMGVFQLTNQPGVSKEQAFSIPFSANHTAQSLSKNMVKFANKFPALTPTQLLQATAASHNIGPGGISGNPATIDNGTHGTPDGHYGASVVGLMNCFGGW